jgi:hypothetical protein
MMSTAELPVNERRITAAANVLRLLDRPISTTAEVARAVEQDKKLGAQVLKMARSPLCGVRSPDLTVARALVLLGFLTIRKLVVVSLCRGMGSVAGDTDRWRRALWVGISAEEITKRIDESAASEALMVAMMRAISDDSDSGEVAAMNIKTEVAPERLDKFLLGAENVATAIASARPALPSTAEIDEALESAGLMPQYDGKLAVDIRRGYELYSSLLS